MIKRLFQSSTNRLFFGAIICLLSATVWLFLPKKQALNPKQFQENFIELSAELSRYLDVAIKEEDKITSIEENPRFVLFIYTEDSLTFWNTNKVPVSNYLEDENGINGLQFRSNGWYFFQSKRSLNKIYTAGFQLISNYSYKNEFLPKEYNKQLSSSDFEISKGAIKNYLAIKNKEGETLFYIGQKTSKTNDSNIGLYLFFTLGISCLIAAAYSISKNYEMHRWLFMIGLISVRLLLFSVDWQSIFPQQEFASPSLFAINEWFGSYWDLTLNILVLIILFKLLFHNLLLIKQRWMVWWLTLLLFVYWAFVLRLTYGIVVNSTIPLQLENVQTINGFTISTFLLLGWIALAFVQLMRKLLIEVRAFEISLSLYSAYFFLASFLFTITHLIWNDFPLYTLTVPLQLYFTLFLFRNQKSTNGVLSLTVIILSIFVISNLSILETANKLKDKETRKFLANQIAVEQDINVELDFNAVGKKLASDPIIASLLQGNRPFNSLADFSNRLEKKYFKGNWESYDIIINLYDSAEVSMVSSDAPYLSYWTDIIKRQGEPSQLDNNVIFLNDNAEGYTYLIRFQIVLSDVKGTLIIGLKSKRLPEEIGFPRLLLTENTKVFSSLENYSIARYSDGKLLKHYGDYNFPTDSRSLPLPKTNSGFFDFENHNHYVFKKSEKTAFVLSLSNPTWWDELTAFAYVFCFWGLIFLIQYLLFSNSNSVVFINTLAFKIQFVLITLVVIALILFGVGSGIFIRGQYQNFNDRIINEKLQSVDREIEEKVIGYQYFSREINGAFLENQLNRLSTIYATDLNLYDPSGYLIASSRPKLFFNGLLSEQMNPEALKNIQQLRKSLFSHREAIGQLSYISAYQPVFNGTGALLGFINLQHFGRQHDNEAQNQELIIAIFDVFLLLFLLSLFVAILVSNWLTSPLKILNDSVMSIRFGEKNEKIDYRGTDEIGKIIDAYNQKLDDLEKAAEQLAQSERESAWREMAKQVAHEIKNPLTPMKLGIQHLMRIRASETPNYQEKVDKLLPSLIEQIDSLTTIANEFSNFAKLPKPERATFDFVSLLSHINSLFENETDISIQFHTSLNNCDYFGDKTQWTQVFNNLIKNAIEATQGQTERRIEIGIEQRNLDLFISISDNGSGIEEGELNKIFIPHFTTKTSGSGIGLSLVKQIVEQHDGKISCTSTVNIGTRFEIILPKK